MSFVATMWIITALALVPFASAFTNIRAVDFMFKNIDPIVHPGSYSLSHLHTFFGSDAITAHTNTSEELRSGCTSINNPNDLSTYWVATLLYTGGATPQPVGATNFGVYYENIENAEIALPENFRVVAGNQHATSPAEQIPDAKVQWYCEGNNQPYKDSAGFPTSTCQTHMMFELFFPDCTNPDTFETAYSGTKNWVGSFKPVNRCPPNMKRIPRIRFSTRYDLRKVIPQGWSGQAPLTLSSGNAYSAHGDEFNGWDKQSLQDMLKATGKTTFVAVNGPRGGPYGPATCKGQDREPTLGTSDYLTSRKMLGLPKPKRSMRFMRSVGDWF